MPYLHVIWSTKEKTEWLCIMSMHTFPISFFLPCFSDVCCYFYIWLSNKNTFEKNIPADWTKRAIVEDLLICMTFIYFFQSLSIKLFIGHRIGWIFFDQLHYWKRSVTWDEGYMAATLTLWVPSFFLLKGIWWNLA